MTFWYFSLSIMMRCHRGLRVDFRKSSVLYFAEHCLTIYLMIKIMNKKVITLVLNVLKYIITMLLGYFGGNAVI